MTPVTTAADRSGAHNYYQFRLRLPDGACVAGFGKVSALDETVNVAEYREPDAQFARRKLSGTTKYPAVTLEQGVTHNVEFAQWIRSGCRQGSSSDPETSLQDLRRDLVLEVYDGEGRFAIGYKLHRCWPAKCRAMPYHDASANAVAIEELKLDTEGYERYPNPVAGRV